MAVSTRLCLCLLACYTVSLSPVSAKPAGGIAKFPDIFLPVSTDVSMFTLILIYTFLKTEPGLDSCMTYWYHGMAYAFM